MRKMEWFMNNNLEMLLWHLLNGPLPAKLFRQKTLNMFFPHIFPLFLVVIFLTPRSSKMLSQHKHKQSIITQNESQSPNPPPHPFQKEKENFH
jgi:hypothetical protein